MTDALSRTVANPAAVLHEEVPGLTSRDLRAASTLAKGVSRRAKSDGTKRLFRALSERLADAAEALAAHERGEANPKCKACVKKQVAHIDSHPGYRDNDNTKEAAA